MPMNVGAISALTIDMTPNSDLALPNWTFPNLRRLSLGGLDDEAVPFLASFVEQHGPTLKHLHLLPFAYLVARRKLCSNFAKLIRPRPALERRKLETNGHNYRIRRNKS